LQLHTEHKAPGTDHPQYLPHWLITEQSQAAIA